MRPTCTRRDFLLLSAAGATLGLIQACATPSAPSPTKAPEQPTPVKPAAQVPQVQATAAPAAATPGPTQAPAVVTKAAGPKKGGTFTVARTANPANFDPLNSSTGNVPHIRALYNTLVRYDAQLKPVPELALSWTVSPDGKVVTFKLRQGVKFHSGREFTADDVKATVEFGQADEAAPMKVAYRAIKKVEVADKYTVSFGFDSVYAGLYDILDSLFIVDKETVANFANQAVGTGPFKLDKFLPGDRSEMVPFKDYWEQGKPYLDRFVLRTIPDLASLVINLESGAVDSIWQPNFRDLGRLKEDKKYTVDMGAPGSFMYDIAINCKAQPFQDKRVRQAVAWSIDRARFARTTMQDLVQPTCLMWPRHSWAYFADLEGKVGYDLEKAKVLLKAAGLEKGFDMELLTSSSKAYGMGELTQILQADLKKVGINAKVVDLDPATYDARGNVPDIITMVHTYGRAGRDPGSLVTGAKAWFTLKERGWAQFESAEYDQLRKDLQSTLDQDKRKPITRKIQEMMLDECFTMPVCEQPRPWVHQAYVKGFGYNMDNSPDVGNVWLDK